MEVEPGVDRVRGVDWSGRDKEALFRAGLPRINQMAVAARPFVAEILGYDALAFGHKLDAVGLGDVAAIDGLVATVPHAENNPPLGFGVDLHPEITAIPAASHIVGPKWMFERCDLAVECCDVGGGRR